MAALLQPVCAAGSPLDSVCGRQSKMFAVPCMSIGRPIQHRDQEQEQTSLCPAYCDVHYCRPSESGKGNNVKNGPPTSDIIPL